jgi:hypothetical protein
MQLLPVALQSCRTQISGGRLLEFFVAEHVHRNIRKPMAHAAAEGAAGHGLQVILDLLRGVARQLGQIRATKTAASRRYETKQLLLGRRATQEPFQLALGVVFDHLRMRRRRQPSHHRRIA